MKKRYFKERISEEKCRGCAKVQEDNYNPYFPATCKVYLSPEAKWRGGKICPMATHIERKVFETGKALNPLKASRRRARGR